MPNSSKNILEKIFSKNYNREGPVSPIGRREVDNYEPGFQNLIQKDQSPTKIGLKYVFDNKISNQNTSAPINISGRYSSTKHYIPNIKHTK